MGQLESTKTKTFCLTYTYTRYYLCAKIVRLFMGARGERGDESPLAYFYFFFHIIIGMFIKLSIFMRGTIWEMRIRSTALNDIDFDMEHISGHSAGHIRGLFRACNYSYTYVARALYLFFNRMFRIRCGVLNICIFSLFDQTFIFRTCKVCIRFHGHQLYSYTPYTVGIGFAMNDSQERVLDLCIKT